MGIGSKLDTLIKERGRNVSDLAKATGVSAPTIYSIIRRDNTKVDLDILQAIADELCVTLDYFTEKGAAEPPEGTGHYLDPEAAELAQEMYDRPELKTLFSTTRNVSREDLEIVQQMLDRMAKDKHGPDDDPA
jgi:transcriptional regulator with XRE-family HTH domain